MAKASLNEVNLYLNISNYNRIAAKKISRFTNQLCFTAMEINFEILLNSRVEFFLHISLTVMERSRIFR